MMLAASVYIFQFLNLNAYLCASENRAHRMASILAQNKKKSLRYSTRRSHRHSRYSLSTSGRREIFPNERCDYTTTTQQNM